MADFVKLGFELAFKYSNPAMILTDGVIGQMMERVVLPPQQKRWTAEEIEEMSPWATTGKKAHRKKNVINSLELDSETMEANNIRFQDKYLVMQDEEVLYEEFDTEDAEYVIVAFGSCARICHKAVELAREEGIKVGLLRPITLFPFPIKPLQELAEKVKGFLTVEMNAGQMVEDVRLSVNGVKPVEFFGRLGGIVPTPDEVLGALKETMVKK